MCDTGGAARCVRALSGLLRLARDVHKGRFWPGSGHPRAGQSRSCLWVHGVIGKPPTAWAVANPPIVRPERKEAPHAHGPHRLSSDRRFARVGAIARRGVRKGLCRRARSGGCRSGREVQIGRRLRHDDAGRPRLVRGLRPGEKQSRSRAAARHGTGPCAEGLFRRRHVQPRGAVLWAGRGPARRPPLPERQRQRRGDDGGPAATLAE